MSSISFYNSESINMLLFIRFNDQKNNSIFLAVRVTHFQGLIYPLSSIRNGSYHKLVKSYYEKRDNDGTTADKTNKKKTQRRIRHHRS